MKFDRKLIVFSENFLLLYVVNVCDVLGVIVKLDDVSS